MKRKIDYSAEILAVFMFLMLFLDQFMFRAEARVGDRTGMTASEALGSTFPVLLVLAAFLIVIPLFSLKSEKLCFAGGMLTAACIDVSILLQALAAMRIDQQFPNGRVSMSVCSYLYIVAAYLLICRYSENIRKAWMKLVIIAIAVGSIVVMLASGMLDHLAIMKEYATNRSQFNSFFLNHLFMSFKVVTAGIVFGVPLGWLAFKKPGAGRVITAVLDTIESIPSLALICVMMFPLSFLSNHFPALKAIGIAGVGGTPVFCALFCYSLFQIVNSTYGALKVVDRQYIDAARGMGMTPAQIFLKVELPIILPVIVAGIRVSLTATILGVTIGSYIGYGGLGKFIITGISGFKIDIVMLGAIPIICLVLLFDYLFRNLVVLIDYYRRKRGAVSI